MDRQSCCEWSLLSFPKFSKHNVHLNGSSVHYSTYFVCLASASSNWEGPNHYLLYAKGTTDGKYCTSYDPIWIQTNHLSVILETNYYFCN